jgi:minichromosome maintenance protein 10
VAVKRDGKACKSWCDTHVSDVCEWHLQHAVEQRRASRPELTAGYVHTPTCSTPPAPHCPIAAHQHVDDGALTARNRKADSYDLRRKWGLKPFEESSKYH